MCIRDRDKLVWVEIGLGVEPGPPARQHIRPLLLAGVSGFFLNVMPRRSKNRHTVLSETRSPCARSRCDAISARVISGLSSTSAKIASPCASIRCVVCHSLEKNGPFRYAPNLYGIVGAPKAREEGYGYSRSLITKGGVWTEDDLDQFLADAGKFAPGSTKSIRVRDAEERKAIIEFLKSPSQ